VFQCGELTWTRVRMGKSLISEDVREEQQWFQLTYEAWGVLTEELHPWNRDLYCTVIPHHSARRVLESQRVPQPRNRHPCSKHSLDK